MNPAQALRRPARILVPLLAATLALTACSSTGSPADTSDAAAEGGWSYTDDTGKTVTLDAAPERIASYADYAIGLLSYDISPVAIFGRVDVASDFRFDDYDISDAAIVGNSYGEVDLEALAEAAPDLIVTGIYPTDREGTLDLEGPLYGLADAEQQAQLEKIAPIVAIEIGGDGLEVVESMNSLAEALGASDEAVATAKEAFDAASADLQAASEETGLEVTQLYADADGIYVVKPEDEPETQLYGQFGVDFTNLNPDGDYYWDIYSWENVGQMMTGDVLLTNIEGFQQEDLAAQPTFADSPALKAGQVHTWQSAALDYASQAAHMEELAEILRSSVKVS
ncbi:ABC transporter substrate-binding protein [Naasia lichenicola]|uniref:ABC transporter substrate-binding protein n=1 Tax=Naasia lichenicola TaxID=2565933 RepID=A0A4S4FKP2_9MICO|nr:ABC transporter substrate-binding protein [Naasia lichenicola]THG29865.1 ABC transporter substrate-binding protein [Naasia lichenicola]